MAQAPLLNKVFAADGFVETSNNRRYGKLITKEGAGWLTVRFGLAFNTVCLTLSCRLADPCNYTIQPILLHLSINLYVYLFLNNCGFYVEQLHSQENIQEAEVENRIRIPPEQQRPTES